ncbi:hypothetical protein RhiLY_04030 [Ceratobasidium sp. AG-Ba]|nr:hypothetical protein RhiLY_04030 [Ceratobasidium sp. AG-Ba]
MSRPVVQPVLQTQRHNTTKLHSVNPDWSAPVVTYEDIKPRTEQPSEEVYLIDVREQDEIAQGSIPSAVPPLFRYLPKLYARPRMSFATSMGSRNLPKTKSL